MTETLKLKREIQKLDRKWTLIYLSLILANIVLGIFLAFLRAYFGLFSAGLGLTLSVAFLINHKLDIKSLIRKNKRLERMDKRIEELEQRNRELELELKKKENHV
jgi:uncharacterized membrane protein